MAAILFMARYVKHYNTTTALMDIVKCINAQNDIEYH